MSVVIGLFVNSLILSRIGLPQPGFLASTTTTPPAVRKTAVFPPPPLSTQRLSFSRSEEHTSELQSRGHLVCRLLLEKKKSAPSEIRSSIITRKRCSM